MATSSLSFIYEELFVFPTSLIKSPGNLMRKVKTEDYHKTDSLSYGTPSTLSPSSSGNSMTKDGDLPLESSDDQNELSDFSVEIRSFLSPSMTDTAHQCILIELNKLPQSFVNGLQPRIVLTDTPNATNMKHSMKTADFGSSKKVAERLYEIIFDSFITKFPEVFSLWSELDDNGLAENPQASEEMREFLRMVREKEIERSFYAVMLNRRYPKASNIVKFKKLLAKIDPKGFSEKWFKNHNREIKRGYKVRFPEEISE